MIEMGITLFFTAAILAVLAIICIARLALGPTTADRAVALDTTNTVIAAALVVLGTAFNQIIFIDVAIIYAMLTFVSTLFISKYMEEKG